MQVRCEWSDHSTRNKKVKARNERTRPPQNILSPISFEFIADSCESDSDTEDVSVSTKV
jgi:hypothetical protein